MKKKHKNNKGLSINTNNIFIQFLLLVVLSSIVIIGYIFVDKKVEERLNRKYSIANIPELVNDIENVSAKGDEIVIEGYAFVSDRNSSNDLISVFLINRVTGDEIWLDMEQIDRTDVNAYFAGEHEYKNTGFIASTDSKKIDDREVYEIIINIDYVEINENGSKDRRRTVTTNRYISDGCLYTYNPIEFDMPDMDVESELLREIFIKGNLCFYEKNAGMYVYQYNDRLYWIANDRFIFEYDDLSYIEFQLHTTQIEKLPERRIQHGYDNIGFNFEEFEYTDENTAPYRVAIRNIPTEYPITYIRTGVYDSNNKEWTWSKYFQLDHKFN